MSQTPAPTKKRNLIVNYVPGYMEEEQLFALFAECGQIKSLRIMRNPDGTGKGYGFVEFYHSESAQKAIEQLDGLRVGKKRLKVAFARPGGSRDGCNLFVKNLPMSWDTSRLAEAFSTFGELLECRVLATNDSQSRRCGFVRFNLPRDATAAMASMNGHIPSDGNFQIKVAHATKQFQKGNQFKSQGREGQQQQYGYAHMQQPPQQQYQYHYQNVGYNSPDQREWRPSQNLYPYQYNPQMAQKLVEHAMNGVRYTRSESPEPMPSHSVPLVQETVHSHDIVEEEESPGDHEEGSTRIILSNLPIFLQEDHVKYLCAKYGNISEISIQRDNNGNSLGCAEIVFKSPKAKKAALTGLNGCVVWDKTLVVN